VPAPLKAELREKMQHLAHRKSGRTLTHRAKLAFGQLRRHHPELIRGYTFEKYYNVLCSMRRKSVKRHSTRKMRAVKPALTAASFEDVITFLETHVSTLTEYERIRANPPRRLKILVDIDHRPHIALDE
jgi:hypothetical protein